MHDAKRGIYEDKIDEASNKDTNCSNQYSEEVAKDLKREFKKSKRQFNDPKEKELFEATRKALTDFGKVCGIIGRQEELKELHSLNPAFAQQIQYEINANYRRRNKMLLILEDAFLYAFNNDKELLLKKEQQPNREEGCEVRKNV